jgi:antitoxin Phd
MENLWQLQTAKNRLSELVDAALATGAQVITRHGKPVVKVVRLNDTEQALAQSLPSFEAFLLSAPRGTEIPIMPRRSARKPFSFD